MSLRLIPRIWSGEQAIVRTSSLHDVLPGDAVIYLDGLQLREISLDDMLWHLDLLYRAWTTDPEMAQTALEVVARGETKPAYRFGKRVLILAAAATVDGEQMI